ncbi:uncharacterized protein LOC143014308 [Genypterus blacodes]|uniref:uncharacterized protein LOC143014308 n=1 Tax=Genypterus blacodes TaxID=154954 RepID=UPI003F759C59
MQTAGISVCMMIIALTQTAPPKGSLSCNFSASSGSQPCLGAVAPVSPPAVSQMCVSPEQMRVSCSSGVYAVGFTLSLDDALLMETKAPGAHNHTVSISLHGQLIGHFMCSAHNNVSRKEAAINLTSCADFYPSAPICLSLITVTASILGLLLLSALGFGINCLHKRKRSQTVDRGSSEGDIVYTAIEFGQRSHLNAARSKDNFNPGI